jgi:hypothetical protein
MNIESLVPFLLILAPFAIAFLLEALVLYFSRLMSFWGSIGTSFLINILSIALVYFIASFILSRIGYEFNGLQLELPVVAFLWWISIIAEGLLLRPFTRGKDKNSVLVAAILMNTLSYLFFYLFVIYSH